MNSISESLLGSVWWFKCKQVRCNGLWSSISISAVKNLAFRLFLKARKILIQTYKYISTVRTINTVTEGNPGDLPMGAFLGVGSYSEWWGVQWSVNQYLGIGKYLFILQVSIMYRFMENSLISISMLSVKKYILIYWYFQYFPVPSLNSHESFISRGYKKFDTLKASSAPSERLFNGGKPVLETKCNRLGDENFENYHSFILTKNSNSTKVFLTEK